MSPDIHENIDLWDVQDAMTAGLAVCRDCRENLQTHDQAAGPFLCGLTLTSPKATPARYDHVHVSDVRGFVEGMERPSPKQGENEICPAERAVISLRTS